MIFSEARSALVLVLCWVAFFSVAPRWRSHVITVSGVVFYSLHAAAYLPLVLGVVLVTYVAHRRIAVVCAIGAVVALMAYFKVGWTAVVPLGFSFLGFELLHVLVERHRGRLPDVSLADMLAYAFFFPARVAGPIRRLPDFLAAMVAAEASIENVYTGAVRVLLGFAKKVLIADSLALTVAERSYVTTPMHAWTIVLAYAFQIFFDFSAYSDVAIGSARMLGIRLPENFSAPYLAVNIREFWNRWHITLSNWVRDYVFMPSGRRLFATSLRRSPAAIAVIGYLLTFLIVGAWHGLTSAFIVWGLYHGALLSMHHVLRTRMPARIAAHPLYHSKPAHALSVAVTFFCVLIGWVPFMTDLPTAGRLLSLMFRGGL